MEFLSGLWDRFLGGHDGDPDEVEPGFGWSDFEDSRLDEGLEYGLFEPELGTFRKVTGRSVDEVTLDWWDELDGRGLRR